MWIPKIRYPIPDCRHQIQDTGNKIQDTIYNIQDTWQTNSELLINLEISQLIFLNCIVLGNPFELKFKTFHSKSNINNMSYMKESLPSKFWLINQEITKYSSNEMSFKKAWLM